MRNIKKKKIFSSEEFSFRLEIVSSGGMHVRSIKGLVPSLMSSKLVGVSRRRVLLQLCLSPAQPCLSHRVPTSFGKGWHLLFPGTGAAGAPASHHLCSFQAQNFLLKFLELHLLVSSSPCVKQTWCDVSTESLAGFCKAASINLAPTFSYPGLKLTIGLRD